MFTRSQNNVLHGVVRDGKAKRKTNGGQRQSKPGPPLWSNSKLLILLLFRNTMPQNGTVRPDGLSRHTARCATIRVTQRRVKHQPLLETRQCYAQVTYEML